MAAVSALGIPCRLSDSAGLYVCINLLYGMLDHNKSAIPTGFIHVPAIPEMGYADKPSMTLEVIFKGITAALETVADSLTD